MYAMKNMMYRYKETISYIQTHIHHQTLPLAHINTLISSEA